jgi:nucleoid-associated protein YgaU
MGRFEDLKAKYNSALETVQQQNVRLEHLHVQDNKLYLSGVAPSEQAKNRVWDAIKQINPHYDDITADIRVEQRAQAAAAGAAAGGASSGSGTRTYTVQPGDSLSKIAKQFYGDPVHYMKIFEANRDKLEDPNKIRPGQELKIPGA